MTTARSAGETLLLYDFLQVQGGAERFSLGLLERLPEVRLLVAARAPEWFPPDPDIRVESLDPRPVSASAGPRAMRAVQAFRHARTRVAAADAVIFSGHYSPLALSPDSRPRRSVYYAHTVPLAFTTAPEVQRLTAGSLPKKVALTAFSAWMRPRFARALRAMDVVFANSRFTADALAQWPGVEAEVLSPPCAIEHFRWRPSGGYFLSFARQEPQKRVLRLVEAFVRSPAHTLVVASDGSEHARLKAAASGAANIRFVRDTEPARIRELLESAMATVLIPEDEPFGLSAVESCAAGKPVLAAASGGLREIIRPGRNGWLLSKDPAVDEIVALLNTITERQCADMRTECEAAAAESSWPAFTQRMRRALSLHRDTAVSG